MPTGTVKNLRKRTQRVFNKANRNKPKYVSPNITAICQELTELQRRRVTVTKARIMQENLLTASVARSLGYNSLIDSEAERKKKFSEATKLIKNVLAKKATCELSRVIETISIGIGALNEELKKLKKEMEALAIQLPVAGWVKHPDRRGFGLLGLAIVVGEAGDLANYANPAKLWRRMQCAPFSPEGTGKTLMGSTWRKYAKREGSLTKEQWKDMGYSPRRRSVSYLIGKALMMLNRTGITGDLDEVDGGSLENDGANVRSSVPGPYRKRYEEAKAKAHVVHPDWPDGRCDSHGMLLATKKLLKDLWRVWNKKPSDKEYEAGKPWETGVGVVDRV